MSPDIALNSPWYYYAFSLLFALALSAWLYFRNRRHADAPSYIVRLLFACRVLCLTLITLFLLNIFLRRTVNETENPLIVLAIDNSASMVSGKDSGFVKQELARQLKELTNSLGDKYSIKTVLFGDKSRQSPEYPDFKEKETDLENMVRDVANNYSGQNTGALIIASDGIYNRGSSPVYQAEKLGFPVYAIACGDTTENKDAFIQKVNHNQVAYLGNNFPVEVLVGSKKLKDKDLKVKIFEGNTLKAEQTVKAGSANFSGTCSFTLSALNTGLVRYRAELSRVEGEENLYNNAQSFVMEVIDNRDKILLLAGAPHPDIAAIREALEGFDNYELEVGYSESFTKPLKAYSLVILQGFGPGQLNFLNECKNSAVPFWIVNPAGPENVPGIRVSASLNRFNEAEPYFVSSFGLFNPGEGLKKAIKEMPAVRTFFGNYSVTNGCSSLINQKIGSVETESPLLYFGEANGLKYGVFIGDGLWRWKLRDFSEHGSTDLFNELIGKSVQYLSVKSDKSFFRVSPPRVVNENENVEFSAEVYNKSYELITTPDVNLVLTNAENKKFSYVFSKNGNSYRLNLGRLAPGDYAFEASVNNDNQLMLKSGQISVREIIAEKLNPVADHKLLFQLAHRTNGKLFYASQLNELKETLLLNETIRPVTYSQSSVSPLVDLRWLFFILLALMAIEWFFRKRYFHI